MLSRQEGSGVLQAPEDNQPSWGRGQCMSSTLQDRHMSDRGVTMLLSLAGD